MKPYLNIVFTLSMAMLCLAWLFSTDHDRIQWFEYLKGTFWHGVPNEVGVSK